MTVTKLAPEPDSHARLSICEADGIVMTNMFPYTIVRVGIAD